MNFLPRQKQKSFCLHKPKTKPTTHNNIFPHRSNIGESAVNERQFVSARGKNKLFHTIISYLISFAHSSPKESDNKVHN